MVTFSYDLQDWPHPTATIATQANRHIPTYGRHMAEPFNPDALCESAFEYARGALEAHRAENYRRAAVEAGTALEHLAKAALARRSPALVADLRNETSAAMIAWLLKVDGAKPPARPRSIGLWEALLRLRPYVTSAASNDDLRTLADMRDGVVHAAQETIMEPRILTAFVQHADALLADLGQERADFWAEQLEVVDALLADATDKVEQLVNYKLASASATYTREYGSLPPEVARTLRAALEVSTADTLASDQAVMRCPVCESNGIAMGDFDVEVEPDWKDGLIVGVGGSVYFTAEQFACRICRLRLDSFAELDAAGVQLRWEVEEADYRDYLPPWEDYDADAAYDREREERAEQEGWR